MANKRRGRRNKRIKRGNWFGRLSTGKKLCVCFGGLFFALLASGCIYAAAKLGQIDTKEIPKENITVNKEAEKAGVGFTNIALFGVDSREGDLAEGTRTDCIIVASLNNKTKEIKLVSVYRDALLDLKGGELQKCNAAYSFGGPEQAINMLNTNLDLDIQKYVTVDFKIVSDVIDLLGGVEIDLKEEEVQYLNEFIGETGEVAGKEAVFVDHAGLQKMDGVQATTYARIRSTAGGDFTRTERQRIVIEKMVEQITKSDLATINEVIDKVFPSVSTNFSVTEILSYAKSFAKYKLGESTGFPIDKTTDTISGLGSIVIPVSLTSNVQKLHEFLYGVTDYTVSSSVQSISSSIEARVGQRAATDDSVLNNQNYAPAPEDVQQESSYGTNNGNGNSGGDSGSNSTTKPDTGGGTPEIPEQPTTPETPDSGGSGGGTPPPPTEPPAEGSTP